MATLNIKTTSVEKLKPYDRNARTHSEKQIEQIAASIKTVSGRAFNLDL